MKKLLLSTALLLFAEVMRAQCGAGSKLILIPSLLTSGLTTSCSGGGGSGSGTVSAGTVNDLAIYTGSTTVGSLATANNGILVTNGSGVPSISNTLELDALGATTQNYLLFNNATAAAVGAQQYSPAESFCGQGWKTTSTAASQSVCFRDYVIPVQGSTAPTGIWSLEAAVNGGSFASVLQINSAASSANLFPSQPSNQQVKFSQDGLFSYTVGSFFSVNTGGGGFNLSTGSTQAGLFAGISGLRLLSNQAAGWQSDNGAGAVDTAFSRGGAGIVYFGTGAVGSVAGGFQATTRGTVAVLTANLKTCSAAGSTPTGITSYDQAVSDATAPAVGVALTGGGTVWAHVHCSLTTGTYIVDGL